ncbi:helix-turn-helix domain-containing protein [Streptomyces olivaceiscleroticus]|uniref:TetR/AcrR family transcriptional regulator n=1 Tax=Streptomyces olivaceiscleroticus TaxID=68245 RepID=A0ABP3J6E3_9ACTN
MNTASTATTKTSQPRLRADAQRNRERIVAAAREVMVEHGAEVPLDEVARRAGVGNATLYRHFPDRADLLHHVTLSVLDRTADRAERALAAEDGDAFQALRAFVHAAVEERIGALCPLLSDGVDKDHPDLLAARDRLERAVESLMGAARESGRLRADIAVGDLMVAITQLTRPLPGNRCTDFDRFVHRHLQLFLDGLMAPARSELPGSAATLDGLRQQCRR